MKSIKYGLFSYSTENIGDEVQSIAARRFLPRVDYYFDRDDIDATKTKPGEEIRLIMNGWYTHKPENWPPKNPDIKPLLVAMHIEQDALGGRVVKSFVSKKSRDYIAKFAPLGARNLPTLELLKNNNIDAFFSGCVTLTLIPDKRVKKQDFVLAVDVSTDVYREMKKRTKREIIRLDTYRSPKFTNEEKFSLAEFWLMLYQSAHSVVTTRLHTMLPCLALGTPVFAIAGRDPKRYSGLIDLVRHSTEEDFLTNRVLFDIDNPGDNPKEYLKIRRSLEKKCADFTGFDSKLSYLREQSPCKLVLGHSFIQAVCNGVYSTLERDLALGDKRFLKKLCSEHEIRIKHLDKELSEKNKLISDYELKIVALENPGIRDSANLFKEAIVRKIKK